MEEFVEQTLLYDFYGELLTEHQKQIYEDYIMNDLSVSEIADAQGISRQGVHDLVKRCRNILEGYEEKLHLVQRFLSTKEKIGEINRLLTDSCRMEKIHKEEMAEGSRQMSELIDRVKELTDKILEEL